MAEATVDFLGVFHSWLGADTAAHCESLSRHAAGGRQGCAAVNPHRKLVCVCRGRRHVVNVATVHPRRRRAPDDAATQGGILVIGRMAGDHWNWHRLMVGRGACCGGGCSGCPATVGSPRRGTRDLRRRRHGPERLSTLRGRLRRGRWCQLPRPRGGGGGHRRSGRRCGPPPWRCRCCGVQAGARRQHGRQHRR